MSAISAQTETPASKLFQPLKVGNLQLQHRVVMAPLTRYRADKEHVHGDLAVEYYRQRSSTPGTLLITEATPISPEAAGYDNIPGIWNDAQIAGWKRVTDAVHANGSFIYLQLWALGRTSTEDVLKRDGRFDVVGAGDIGIADHAKPRPLTLEEIESYISKYAIAAKNAVTAGFDGVEIHGANGYLVDQFIQDVSNNRTDRYGGSVENRARFALEAVDSVASAIGAERTALRLSPWSEFQEMRMKDPVPTYTYLVEQLALRHSNLAYLHVVEARPAKTAASSPETTDAEPADSFSRPITESNQFIRDLWLPRPLITASGYSEVVGKQLALEAAEQAEGVLIAFGRSFISNPDLPARLQKGLALSSVDFSTIYSAESPLGYTDYPFAEETKA